LKLDFPLFLVPARVLFPLLISSLSAVSEEKLRHFKRLLGNNLGVEVELHSDIIKAVQKHRNVAVCGCQNKLAESSLSLFVDLLCEPKVEESWRRFLSFLSHHENIARMRVSIEETEPKDLISVRARYVLNQRYPIHFARIQFLNVRHLEAVDVVHNEDFLG